MRTLMKFLFLLTCSLGLLASCTKSEQEDEFLSANELKSAKMNPTTVTVPFIADFTGTYVYVGPNEKCGAPYVVQVIVDFEGNATHLGKMTGNFAFCVEADGTYGETVAYMVAANGDTLFVACAGKVIEGRMEDHPTNVNSYWRDPFEILGGTGRFEGATGSGTTDDFNNTEDPYSHHYWRGTITMLKGK